MRVILLVAGMLVGLGLLAGELPRPSAAVDSPNPVRWVRARDGWEKPSDWSAEPAPVYAPALHPLPVAAGELLVSLLALVAYRDR